MGVYFSSLNLQKSEHIILFDMVDNILDNVLQDMITDRVNGKELNGVTDMVYYIVNHMVGDIKDDIVKDMSNNRLLHDTKHNANDLKFV